MGKSSVETSSAVTFHINGEKFKVDSTSNISATTALVDFIRDYANLKGTKYMCREGGCGACIVMARVVNPETGSEVIKSVNSCLTPVLSCDGWDITTVERLGNKHEGYNKIQNRLVSFYGTQCGYCTPGMLMNMQSLYESKLATGGGVGMADVEQSLDGNICRCTGYRPILDAFKSLANDAPPELRQKCADIEDCATCPLKKNDYAQATKAKQSVNNEVKFPSGEKWVTAKTLEGAFAGAGGSENVRFVAGNTSTGIFKNEGPYKIFIDINGIPDLKKASVDIDSITFGGGTTITELIKLLRSTSKQAGFEYGTRVATHLERVANVSVRNNGTIAGNLMIKHKHNEFPSDVFTILETLGATITLVSAKIKKSLTGSEKVSVQEQKPINLQEFLTTDMSMKLIKSIMIPIMIMSTHFRSFKITRRYQNAHAYVNAGFLLKVNKAGIVEEKPRLVFGGISLAFIHASETEAFLEGKSLKDENTLKGALAALDKEVKPEGGKLEASKEYRVRLVKGLLYKTILEILGTEAPQPFRSGGTDLIRKVTSSKQFMDNGPVDATLYKAVPKYEGGIQASGEAEYTGDIPFRTDELFAAYVTSNVACAGIKEINAWEALRVPGVIRFITAKDVPGENNAMKDTSIIPMPIFQPVFAKENVEFYGQPLGLILATSGDVAVKAAKLVKVTYENEQKPVIRMEEAIEKAKTLGMYPYQTAGCYKVDADKKVEIEHKIEGTFKCGSQYHFYMETQSVVCHPREDGIDVYASTQSVDFVQNAISVVLGVPTNSVNLQVRRIGGGFGGKASNAILPACACAVATWVTNRPVRLIMDLETNMTMLGKRLPYLVPYEVGFDETGRIGSLKVDFICDAGFSPKEPNSMVAVIHFQNVYKANGWEVDTHHVLTNTSSNTWCRAPGSIKSIALIEWIMDQIAYNLNKDPLEIRQVNMLETGDANLFTMFDGPTYEGRNLIPEMIENMKEDADYEERKAFIENFNKENRWRKRGMSVIPVRYGISYFWLQIPVTVAVYHFDGHVAVSHGGIEMGQGINTKIIQTVAHALGIPIDRVKVKPTNNFVGANAMQTAGSLTSELACHSALKACEQIRENLKPILEKMENPSWEKLIKDAYTANVKLTASHTPTPADGLKGYDVWILNVTEVEIDVLTGEYKVVRTDLYEDTGKSLSPGIDLGQIEGAYMHGQGYWTTEKIVHDEETGKLLTNGTWDYKVPFTKDIPEDFRVTLLSNAPNPTGVLRSKATGEPSTDAAFAVVLAMRNAIAAARKDVGNNEWFDMCQPVTPEDIARLCMTKDSHLTL